jgi:suppressor of G2 allele of SKP1
MRKCEAFRWESLESVAASSASEKDEASHKYPSSSHYTRDWDKLVAEVKQEEKDEKPEGDAALNKLFQQIYQDGSDDVKKAMNKSFVSVTEMPESL